MNSTSNKKYLAIGILLWLGIWQIAALLINQEILLASPIQVIIKLFSLLKNLSFYSAIIFSLSRIMLGFFLALILSIIFAILSHKKPAFKLIIEPLIHTINITPVAAIVIVLLIWISSKNLSIVLSFMAVLPILYSNILSGIDNTDKALLEMAKIYNFNKKKKLKTIYIPSIFPYFLSSCTLALGISFKSGIAAEIIGIPIGGLGEKMYDAKVFFATSEIFAYTIVIILLSILCQKIIISLIKVGGKKWKLY